MQALCCKTRKHCRSSKVITLLIVIADKHTMDMDETLEGIDSMERSMCHICQQDIPIDEDSPDGLLRHVCVWILFIKAPVYLGMRNDWVCCLMCGTCINITHMVHIQVHVCTLYLCSLWESHCFTSSSL